MKKFLPLWIGDMLSDIGTQAFLFVIPVIAVTVLGVNDSQLGVIMAIIMTAPGVLAAYLGAIADRLPAYRSLHLANLARLAIMLTLVALTLSGALNTWLLVACALAISCISVLYDCLIAAVIPRLVPAKHLTRANSLKETGATVTVSAGEIVGTAVLARLGHLWVFVLNCVTCVFSTIGLLLYRDRSVFELGDRAASKPGAGGSGGEEPRPGHAGTAKPEASSLGDAGDAHDAAAAPGRTRLRNLQSIARNFRIWRSSAALVSISVSALLFNFTIGMVATLLVPFALHSVGLAVWQLGLLSVPAVVLGLLTPIVLPAIERALGPWLTTVAAMLLSIAGLALFWYAAHHTGWVGFGFLSLGLAVLDVAAISALVVGRSYQQRVVPAEHQGGVEGLVRSITWGADPIAAITAGVLSTFVLGREGAIAFSGVFLVLGVAVLIAARRRWLPLPADPQ